MHAGAFSTAQSVAIGNIGASTGPDGGAILYALVTSDFRG